MSSLSKDDETQESESVLGVDVNAILLIAIFAMAIAKLPSEGESPAATKNNTVTIESADIRQNWGFFTSLVVVLLVIL